MKLHESTVRELIRIFQVHGGHREEWRHFHQRAKIDFSMYKQQSGNDVIVLTEILKKSV